ncbi:LysR family transcriptional regulator [Devosia nitrariae]|uniref:Transcriptional regulator n=1 Tax=Devosia nitrariae TaxID=2071872 RepID=A0ABQ5WAK5_9HYPH|nr:LysR family transcriptional regulator [Devosia nitrariae]GLQ57103.1 transcriptional regulator [Devosia nitrariae]
MILASTALPSLQGLRAFLAVAETGSFTKAATALGLTQTAVSHQIAQFEDWLGGQVFVRDRRAVGLTPLGERLLPQVRESLTDLHQVLSAARQTGQRQKLSLSTTPEFGTQWLAPRLENFVSAHPGISVSVTLEYRRADLMAGEADIAIWLGSGGPGLSADRLMLEEEFAVSSPELSARLPKRKALLAAPLLHYKGERHTVLDWRRWHSQLYGAGEGSPGDELAREIDMDAGPVYATFSDMLEACRRGEGFALVRTSLVADDLKAGRLVRCFVEVLPSDLHYHLVTAPQRRPRPEITIFRQWIFSQVQRA